jgi:hypothetical protein
MIDHVFVSLHFSSLSYSLNNNNNNNRVIFDSISGCANQTKYSLSPPAQANPPSSMYLLGNPSAGW